MSRGVSSSEVPPPPDKKSKVHEAAPMVVVRESPNARETEVASDISCEEELLKAEADLALAELAHVEALESKARAAVMARRAELEVVKHKARSKGSKTSHGSMRSRSDRLGRDLAALMDEHGIGRPPTTVARPPAPLTEESLRTHTQTNRQTSMLTVLDPVASGVMPVPTLPLPAVMADGDMPHELSGASPPALGYPVPNGPAVMAGPSTGWVPVSAPMPIAGPAVTAEPAPAPLPLLHRTIVPQVPHQVVDHQALLRAEVEEVCRQAFVAGRQSTEARAEQVLEEVVVGARRHKHRTAEAAERAVHNEASQLAARATQVHTELAGLMQQEVGASAQFHERTLNARLGREDPRA